MSLWKKKMWKPIESCVRNKQHITKHQQMVHLHSKGVKLYSNLNHLSAYTNFHTFVSRPIIYSKSTFLKYSNSVGSSNRETSVWWRFSSVQTKTREYLYWESLIRIQVSLMALNQTRTNAVFYTWDGVTAALQKGIWGCWLAGGATGVINVCALGSQGGKPHPGVHQTQHHQFVKRGDYPTLFSTGAASPWVLCAVQVPTILKGCEGT